MDGSRVWEDGATVMEGDLVRRVTEKIKREEEGSSGDEVGEGSPCCIYSCFHIVFV